ncbi:MAG: sigma-E factor negative regulatory protein [Ideonella sp.]|nr:sigma-E factor negative regulatory protein [Ideonella sp.]
MTFARPQLNPLTAEDISALFDGEAEASELERLSQQWSDEDTRAHWHTCSLIGDVLRSEDLAQAPRHDAAFLAGVRQRLAQEPVVLSPTALRSDETRQLTARASRRYWLSSAAVAATVAVAVGVWTNQTDGLSALNGPTLAQMGSPSEASAQLPLIMVRDPELDRYLAAHRQYVQGPALAAPGGVRQVAVQPGR